MINQEKFAKLLVASGESSADMRYATKLSTPDDFIWIRTPDADAVIISELEYNRARENVPTGTAVLLDCECGGPLRIDIFKNLQRNYQLSGFIVPENFPLGLAEIMSKNGIKVIVEHEPFFPDRKSKSSAELSEIRRSEQAAEAGLARGIELLKKCEIDSKNQLLWNGKVFTSEMLRAEIDSELLRHNMFPTGTICAGSKQSSQPHNPGSGPLYANTPIVMDIFPRSQLSGYWGDLTRTVVKGNANYLIRKAYDAVLEAREFCKSSVEIGASTQAIHQSATEILNKRGFKTGKSAGGMFGFFHGLGHGVGLDIHEFPRLSSRSKEILKGGEVFSIEPGLYYPEWGGIRLEDLMYLSPEGHKECITSAPDFLEI